VFEPNTNALKTSNFAFFAQLASGAFNTLGKKNLPQIDFMVFRNFNIYVSSAAYLMLWETVS